MPGLGYPAQTHGQTSPRPKWPLPCWTTSVRPADASPVVGPEHRASPGGGARGAGPSGRARLMVDQHRVLDTQVRLCVGYELEGEIRVRDRWVDLATVSAVYLRPYD